MSLFGIGKKEPDQRSQEERPLNIIEARNQKIKAVNDQIELEKKAMTKLIEGLDVLAENKEYVIKSTRDGFFVFRKNLTVTEHSLQQMYSHSYRGNETPLYRELKNETKMWVDFVDLCRKVVALEDGEI